MKLTSNRASGLFYLASLVFISFLPVQICAADYNLSLIKRFYSIGTATINGTYYPVGNSIARMLTQNLKKQVFLAEPTNGSLANVEYLRKGQIDLALMQSDVAWQAAHGAGPFSGNPLKELRILASLYSEVIQIVVRKNSPVKSIVDLKGCRISVGSKESGSAANAVQVMAAAGLQPEDYELVYERFTRATESLRDGYVDAVYYTGGIPADGITRLATKTEIKLVEIPENIQQNLVKQYPYFSPEQIPEASYNGQTARINTIGLRALLVASDQLSENEAKKILEVIYRNSSMIAAQNMTSVYFRKEDALKGFAEEMIHSGAKAFFTGKTQKAD